MSEEKPREYVATGRRIVSLAKARMLGTDPIVRLPDNMFIHMDSPNAEAINADPEWGRALILLGSLYRKHGPFQIDLCEKAIRSMYGVQPR